MDIDDIKLVYNDAGESHYALPPNFKKKFTDFVDELLRVKNRVSKKTDGGFTDIEVSDLFDVFLSWVKSGKFSDTDVFFMTKSKLTYSDKEYLRDDFINFVEDGGLENDIVRYTIKKWEAFEDKIKTKRKKKY